MSTEKQTRKQIIDQRLLNAGWKVSDRSQVAEEFDIVLDGNVLHDEGEPYAGHQFSDYVLLGKDGKPLAIVEAKKTSKDAEIGREQAKQYCYNIKKVHSGELPFNTSWAKELFKGTKIYKKRSPLFALLFSSGVIEFV